MTLWYISIFAINIALSIAALIGLRYGMAALVGVHVKDELDKKDNIAFGIVIAGAVLALMMIMSAAISGVAEASFVKEIINVLSYAILGIVLLKIGLLVQEYLVLRNINLKEEIRQGNVAAAIVMAVNLISVGIIIRGAIAWIEVEGLLSILSVMIVFAISQVILAAVTFLRLKVFASRHQGGSWQEAIKGGNVALSIRFAGQLIGTAIAVVAVGSLVDYASTLFVELVYLWSGFSLLAMIAVWLLYRLMIPIVLTKVNIVEEVDQQGNLGVAAIEAAVFIGIALLLLGFLSY